MKLADINAIGGILSALRINRITDRAARESVNETHLAIAGKFCYEQIIK